MKSLLQMARHPLVYHGSRITRGQHNTHSVQALDKLHLLAGLLSTDLDLVPTKRPCVVEQISAVICHPGGVLFCLEMVLKRSHVHDGTLCAAVQLPKGLAGYKAFVSTLVAFWDMRALTS